MPSNPYLSIVVAARNDNHGGDMLKRMQIFASSILAQADQFRLPIELIVVDWNPPIGKPPLAEALKWPEQSRFCRVRFIQVPPELHNRYKHASQLPLYQMIAKNVGIRRAEGEFVIATNIDILFSDELFAFIADQKLDANKMYRCQRHDVNEDIPLNLTHGEHLTYCRNNLERINTRFGSENLLTGDYACVSESDDPVQNGFVSLHTNACGDFTMLSREAWAALRGYPEFDMYSFHLDSLLCLMAHYAGYTEIDLAPPLVTYHIEHGGGFKPKDDTLDRSLASRRVMRMSDAELALYARSMHSEGSPIIFCDKDWGMAGENLPETSPFDISNSPAECQPATKAASGTAAKDAETTLFTIPEPFTGDALTRQRNALKSWRLLMPNATVILIGNVEGAAEAAAEFGMIHSPVEADLYGHIRISEVFDALNAAYPGKIKVYLEPDLIMTPDFPAALAHLFKINVPFLAGGRSHTVVPWAEFSFGSEGLCGIMRDEAVDKGLLSETGDPGFLAFNCNFDGYVPPFTSSSPDWKRWLMGEAVSRGITLIDLTPAVTAPRQWREGGTRRNSAFNILLAKTGAVSLMAAGCVLTAAGLKKESGPIHPEPGYEDFCRFFFRSIDDARVLGNIGAGLRLAEWFEKLGGHGPEVLYQVHVQRGKLLLIGANYEAATIEFEKAVAIDRDEEMPAADLFRRTLFVTESSKFFDWENYRLSLAEVQSPGGAGTDLAARFGKAAQLFSRNRFMSAAQEFERCVDLLNPSSGGAHFAISVSLARGGKIREALQHAELEMQSVYPHPDAAILLQCLNKSMVLPGKQSGTVSASRGA